LILLEGLKNTVLLSFIACIIGIFIGVIVCMCNLAKNKFLNIFAKIYIDIIRGTPAFVQLMVMYFIIFKSFEINKLLIAGLAFGINSGAYVAEIIRSGILSVGIGQQEAGRSLGLSSSQTMRYIILPQAIKNILPALTNEFIVLVKETCVAGYIAVMDLMKAAATIQSRTYDPAWSLIAVAVIYYLLTKSFTIMSNKLEAKLRKS